MEKILFRKLILDISLRALIITFTIGLIVWIIQAANYLDFVIDDGHNFTIYFYYNLFNFPKIIHRILPFVFGISVFFELIKYERNNELLIFWTNGITKKKFISNLINFSIVVMFLQILLGSIISPSSQLKAREFLKNSNMDFLPNLIKQGKFIDTVSGLTIFISEKTDKTSFKNIYIQEGNEKESDINNVEVVYDPTVRSNELYSSSYKKPLKTLSPETKKFLEEFANLCRDEDLGRIAMKENIYDLENY